MYEPPFHITPNILRLVASVVEKVGEAKALHLELPPIQLRKKNRIRSIQASLAIEGNTLTFDQVTDVLEGRQVVGPAYELLEVKNALAAYEQLELLNGLSLDDFLAAHRLLMQGLLPDAGLFRKGSVGIAKGNELTHLAPPASRVPYLMQDLFDFLNDSDELMLIKSCIFHYEVAFIHPFTDGNGRIGRLWHSVLLAQRYPALRYMALETMVRQHQQGYYQALEQADRIGHSTPFVAFMLEMLNKALELLLAARAPQLNHHSRIQLFIASHREACFSRKDYLRFFPTLSTATASRDLRTAVEQHLLLKEGDKRTTRYCLPTQLHAQGSSRPPTSSLPIS